MDDYTGYDLEDPAVKIMLARAQALRNVKTPQGQMVTGEGIYVPPSKLQMAMPTLSNLAADTVENKALERQTALQQNQQKALGEWLKSAPTAKTTYGAGQEGPTMATTEPTDQDRLVWAAKGANNPLAKALAMDVTKDTLVNAPIRLEKSMLARERMDENQRRFDLDRAERQRANIDRANQRDAELEYKIDLAKKQGGDPVELERQRQENRVELLRLRGIQQATHDERMVTGATDRAAATAAAKNVAGPKLTSTQQEKLIGYENEKQGHESLLNSFKDDYAGTFKAWGESKLGGTLLMNDPHSREVAEWWSQFNSGDIAKRHELFGSALTAGEERAWRKITVFEMSNPDFVKDIIRQRKESIDRHYKIAKETYRTGGQNLLGTSPGARSPEERVVPAVQAERNQGAIEVKRNELRQAQAELARTTNIEGKRDLQRVIDGLKREIARDGGTTEETMPGTDRLPNGVPTEKPKTVKWSDLK